MKYLIWAVVIYFAWRWYMSSKEKAASRGADDARPTGEASPASSAAPGAAATEKMVGCAHCGIHMPLSEALIGSDQRHYCCDEHRALHNAS